MRGNVGLLSCFFLLLFFFLLGGGVLVVLTQIIKHLVIYKHLRKEIIVQVLFSFLFN